MIKEILNNIYWIGSIDKDLQVFDIVMETKYGIYGWSGEGVDFIFNRFNDMRLKTLP